MRYYKTKIEGVWLLEPDIFRDSRGYFCETYNKASFDAHIGGNTVFIQDNESKSSAGVVRGLHYQTGDFAQAKLVRVVSGSVFDVAVDLRKSSRTFGKYVGFVLSDENHKQLFIPRGFAHGFLVLSETAVFNYKVDNVYSPEHEASVQWNDPDINIVEFRSGWMVPGKEPITSEKDMRAPLLKDAIYLFD